MKMVDDKGKLFGKINVVDLLVILLVVVAAAAVGFKLLISADDGNTDAGQPMTLIYTVLVQEVGQDTYDNLLQFVDASAGKKDQMMASGDMLEGYVVAVEATPHVHTDADTWAGEDTFDLVFTAEAIVTDQLLNKVGTQEVRIGKTHTLKTVHFEFEKSTILTCEWEEVDDEHRGWIVPQ